MEQKAVRPVCLMNKQANRISQALIINGCRVRVNYLPSRMEEEKENVLGNIQKSLLAACQAK